MLDLGNNSGGKGKEQDLTKGTDLSAVDPARRKYP